MGLSEHEERVLRDLEAELWINMSDGRLGWRRLCREREGTSTRTVLFSLALILTATACVLGVALPGPLDVLASVSGYLASVMLIEQLVRRRRRRAVDGPTTSWFRRWTGRVDGLRE